MSEKKPSSWKFYAALLLCTGGIVASGFAAVKFADAQYTREMQHWQVKLGLIADSRAETVHNWIEGKFRVMRELADNASLQVYMTALLTPNLAPAPGIAVGEPDPSGQPQPPAEPSMQDVYLKNLLTITAEQNGFSPVDPQDGVNANVERAGSGGIALLDKAGKTLVATAKMPEINGGLLEFVTKSEQGKTHLLDMQQQADGQVRMGFLLPVYAIQGDNKASDQIGWVFGIQEIKSNLFAMLQPQNMTEKSLNVSLVREQKDGLLFLSPKKQGDKPLSSRLDGSSSKQQLAPVYAVQHIGELVNRPDTNLTSVIMTSRSIEGTPWVLLAQVDENEALADAIRLRNALLMQLMLGIGLVTLVVITAWTRGASRRTAQLNHDLSKTLQIVSAREAMLTAITNSVPGSVFMVDVGNHCRFGNEALAKEARMPVEELTGKPLEHLLGQELAEPLKEANDSALRTLETTIWTRRDKSKKDEERVLRYKHVPLKQLPVESAIEGEPGILVIEEDITQVVQERERRLHNLKGLAQTLVSMVDARDPHAANHSKIVATIAMNVAEEMQLGQSLIETAETAGLLMNIGKIDVAIETLTKATELNDQERQAIRASLINSAEAIKDIDFEGPVAETLRQSIARFDGRGKPAIKGEDILPTARILAAANAFVGMVSPRAYRQAMSPEEALKLLSHDMNTLYDPKVVMAIGNFIENQGGKLLLSALGDEKS